MEKLLVIGAKGQLGKELMHCLAGEKTELGTVPLFDMPYIFEGVDIDELDITDREAVLEFIQKGAYTCLINCAAFTNVNLCESQEEAAFQANKVGPENLALAAKAIGAKLIHVSTDYVFDGEGTSPYKETDPVCPVSAYGRTKAAGEEAIEQVGGKYQIIRTAWLYGYYGRNFVKTIQQNGRDKGQLSVVSDQVGNPTNAADLAHHILKLVTSDETGIFHGTGRGLCSWYDFASKIIEFSGIRAKVLPCRTEDYPTPAKRPHYSALDHSHLDEAVGDEFRPWEEALAYFVQHQNDQIQEGI
ncbi:MAG: dTDP-4-dehydrorhamnose reductase [Firmicutes bacterium]|nr:dTDP-4-dehydrorhamnose reductase [Bacillota bacterium]